MYHDYWRILAASSRDRIYLGTLYSYTQPIVSLIGTQRRQISCLYLFIVLGWHITVTRSRMESRGCTSVLKGTRTKDTGWPKNIGNVRTLPSADYSSIDIYPKEIVLVLGLLLVLVVFVLLYFYILLRI